LASFEVVRHDTHWTDFACMIRPHAHIVFARHAGHRRCRLEGLKLRPHSLHYFMVRTYGRGATPFGAIDFRRCADNDRDQLAFDPGAAE
jgi:hypothetical protein